MEKTSKMIEIEKEIEEPIEEFLKREYIDNGKSLHEIEDSLGVGHQAVSEWMKRFKIPTRSLSEAQNQVQSKKSRPTEDELHQMYVVERKTAVEIGKIVGVSKTTSAKWVREAGLKELVQKSKLERPKNKESKQKIQGQTGHFIKPSKEQLEKWYSEQLKSSYVIAKLVRVDPSSITNWLKEYKIPIRSNSQSKFALKGRLAEEPSEEVLDKLYNVEKKTTYDLAKIYDVSDITVGRWLEKAGIKRRDPIEARYLSMGKEPLPVPTKEELERWYLEDKKSTHIIAEELGVEQITVWRWLNKHGILKREIREAQFTYHGKDVKKPSNDELHRLYVQEERTLDEIAQTLGIDPSTIQDWLEEAGIERRDVAFGYKKFLECKDGDLVKSTLERKVDDWLYENGIPHEYDKKIPGKTQCRYDFKVGDTYIEIWGLVGYGAYEDKMEEKKIPYYEKHELKRIDIFPEDFGSKNHFVKKLKPILKYLDPKLRRQGRIGDYQKNS